MGGGRGRGYGIPGKFKFSKFTIVNVPKIGLGPPSPANTIIPQIQPPPKTAEKILDPRMYTCIINLDFLCFGLDPKALVSLVPE